MRRLSKAHLEQISAAVDACAKEASGLEDAINEYNGVVSDARDAVESAVSVYNEKLADLKAIYADIATEARDYYEERSEKWQEGDAGQQYSEWLDRLEVEFDEVEVELPGELDVPDLPDFTDLETLPPESPDVI